MIRLFVIDDHPVIANGIRYKFHTKRDGIKVIGSAVNVGEAIHSMKQEELDIFILDLMIPNTSPLNNVRLLKTKYPGKKIIVYTVETSSVWINSMHRLGVDAYITKDQDDNELKRDIFKVYNGEKVFPEHVLLHNNGCLNFETNVEDDLKSTSNQIITLISQGWSINQISDILGIPFFRASNLLKKIRRQYHAKNNCELVARMFQKILNSKSIENPS